MLLKSFLDSFGSFRDLLQDAEPQSNPVEVKSVSDFQFNPTFFAFNRTVLLAETCQISLTHFLARCRWLFEIENLPTSWKEFVLVPEPDETRKDIEQKF